VSEDDYWVKIKEGHPWGELRTPEEQSAVQEEVVRRVVDLVTRRKNVVLEFILYEDPPRPLMNYQSALHRGTFRLLLEFCVHLPMKCCDA